MIECPALPPGSLAQSVEQRTFNPLVAGSNPARPTIGTEVRWHRVRTPGLLAQLVEQRTLNPLVAGSNPAGPTNHHAGGSRSGHLPAFGGNEAVRLRNAVRVPHRMGIRMSDHTSSDLQPHQRLKASAIDSDFGVDVYALVLSRLGVRLDQFGHDRETQGRRIGHWLRRLQDRKPIEPSSLRQLIEQIHLADEASRDGRLRVLTPPSHGQALGYASQTRPEWFSEWARDALTVRSLKAVNRLSTVFRTTPTDEEFKHLLRTKSPPAPPSTASPYVWLEQQRKYKEAEGPALQLLDLVRARRVFRPDDPEPTVTLENLNNELAVHAEIPKSQQRAIKSLVMTDAHRNGGRPKKKKPIK